MPPYMPFHSVSAYENLPKVIAHRGASGEAPENTAAAIRLAAEQGAQWAEVDVTISAEGVAVIFHDNELSRCTNGSGLIIQQRLSDLKELDAGSWFDQQYSKESILTLTELFTLANQLEISLNLEVKPTSGREAETVWAIRNALQQVPFEQTLLLSSFNPYALQACLQHLPDISRALNVEAIPYNWQERVEELKCQGLHFSARFADEKLISQIVQHGLGLACYTVNSPEQAQKLWRAGVLSVFSDYPFRIIQAARISDSWHNH